MLFRSSLPDDSNLEQVLVGALRPELTQRTKDLIQRVLDFYNTGIIVTSVNLTDVQVPDAVIPSQRDANKALADQERFVREAEAYANGIICAFKATASNTGAATLNVNSIGAKAIRTGVPVGLGIALAIGGAFIPDGTIAAAVMGLGAGEAGGALTSAFLDPPPTP